jgi:hypothetical protein
MPNPKNIERHKFKKGQPSPNPKGRPKKLPEIDDLLADVLGKDVGNGLIMAEKILLAIAKKAAAGDVRAAEVLMDRAYGRPKQSMEIDGSQVLLPPIIQLLPPDR